MLTGFIYHLPQFIELHVSGYPYYKFIGYTETQAKKQYRILFNLKYKKITWL